MDGEWSGIDLPRKPSGRAPSHCKFSIVVLIHTLTFQLQLHGIIDGLFYLHSHSSPIIHGEVHPVSRVNLRLPRLRNLPFPF